jgi:CHAT domain-containing protein
MKINYLTAIACLLLIPSVFFAAEGTDTLEQLTAAGKECLRKGDFENAARHWEQAIKLSDPEKDAGTYLDLTLNLANVWQTMGFHSKALSVLQKALPFAEKSSDKYRKAMFFSSLGDLHLSLGNAEETVTYLTKGMETANEANHPKAAAMILNNVGNAFAAEQDEASAVEFYGQALDLIGDSEQEDDLHLKSKVWLNWIRIEIQKGNFQELSDMMDYILLEIGDMPDSYHKASDMITLSRLTRKLRKKLADTAGSQSSEAEKLQNDYLAYVAYLALEKAVQISEALNDHRMRSYAYGYMGQLYEEQSRYDDAVNLTRRAIFFAQQGDFPQTLYLWQWQSGRLFKAQGDVENAVKAYQTAVKTLNPIRGELFRGFRSRLDSFNENVKPVYLGLAEMLLKQAETLPDDASRQKKLIEARDTMEILKTAELEDFFADECVIAMRAEKVTLERTPPHTAILYPIMLPDALALLLTLPDGIKHISVPVGSEKIRETVQEYRIRLQTRVNNRFLYSSQQLYDWVIRPAEADMKANEVDTLVVAPDGALRLIPFSTLHDGEHFLIEKYAIGTIPAISLTDPKPVNKENFDILIGGLSEARQGFSALPSVPAELRDIREIMSGKILIQNNDYTIENMTAAFKEKPYSLVHIATHGVFGGTPEESFLLAYEDKLTMDRLEQLIGMGIFRKQKVELLTLSACQTALGNERAALGLAGVAVKAGVKSAIATLWFVDDEATSLAIREFYRQFKEPGMSKAKAMQNVQKKLIAQRRYWHPLYWAPFLVIGNWM